MTPSGMMKMGAATALIGWAGVIFAPEYVQSMASIMMAMGACLFGKGYGVWEERNR